jgi:hypothetical protein
MVWEGVRRSGGARVECSTWNIFAVNNAQTSTTTRAGSGGWNLAAVQYGPDRGWLNLEEAFIDATRHSFRDELPVRLIADKA